MIRKKTTHFAILVLLLTSTPWSAAEDVGTLGGVEYGIDDWPENGLGNHRAVVAVEPGRGLVIGVERVTGDTPRSSP